MEQHGAVDWLPPVAALAHFEPPEGAFLSLVGQVRLETRTRYGFRIGELGLLINPDTGSEVLSMPQVAIMPVSPPGFLGLINLRSNLVPLYELQTLIDKGSPPAETNKMALIFGKGALAVGINIDNYPSALSALRPLSELPPIPDTLQNHVTAGFVQDNVVWLEFNHESFFDEVCNSISLMKT